MTIWEYLRTPHPWFDTTNYQPWQIVLFTIGAVLWIVAYVLILKSAFHSKKLIIPVAAVVCNFGSEVSASLFFVPDMGAALVLAYWAWMVLDMVIIYNLFRYGKDQWTSEYLKENFAWLVGVSLVFSIAFSSFFMTRYDLPMGVIDNYIVNVVMSVMFLGLFVAKGADESDRILGWTKFLGTGIISVMFLTKYPDNDVLTTLYVIVAFFDILYLVLVSRRLSAGRAS